MFKKRTLFLLKIFILAFVVFAAITTVFFYLISSNPIDKISTAYIRTATDIEAQYGEIIFIGKNVFHKTEKNESIIKSPYGVETATGRMVVYVTLEKKDDEWKPTSYEVVEVIPNEQ